MCVYRVFFILNLNHIFLFFGNYLWPPPLCLSKFFQITALEGKQHSESQPIQVWKHTHSLLRGMREAHKISHNFTGIPAAIPLQMDNMGMNPVAWHCTYQGTRISAQINIATSAAVFGVKNENLCVLCRNKHIISNSIHRHNNKNLVTRLGKTNRNCKTL